MDGTLATFSNRRGQQLYGCFLLLSVSSDGFFIIRLLGSSLASGRPAQTRRRVTEQPDSWNLTPA